MPISYETCNVLTSDGKYTINTCGVSRWFKMIGINLLAFGLELCASAGFSYIPPVLLKKGFSDSALSRIVGIGPLISLILVPLIGRWSDTCRSRFGRRRPFMLALGLIILLSLLMIPFCDELAKSSGGLVGDALVLAIGVIGLDFSTQAIMNPCKALIPDIFQSAEEQDSAFAVYSFMLGAGGFVGYLISSINWVDTYLGVIFGGQEKAVFCFLAVIFCFLLMVNLILAKEIPFERINGFQNGILFIVDEDCVNIVPDQLESKSFEKSHQPFHHIDSKIKRCHFFKVLKKFGQFFFHPYIKALQYGCKSCFRVISSCLVPVQFLLFEMKFCFFQFLHMPPVLFYLFLSNVFGWMAVMCHDIYYTDFIGQVIYKGHPNAEDGSATLELYNQGVRMGSWGLLLHCLSASAYSALIHEKFTAKFGMSNAYISGTVIFTLCMVGTVKTDSVVLVNFFCALSGIGYSTLTTVPCSLVTVYHSAKKKYYGSKDNRGIGEDMAVLDSASYVAQIIPSFFLGFLAELVGSSSIYMIVAAFCGVMAIYTAFYIHFPSK